MDGPDNARFFDQLERGTEMKNAMNQVFPAMIHERPTRSIPVDGLTKRELFTGMVAAGSSDCEIVDVQRFARYCVKVADALLLALEEAQ